MTETTESLVEHFFRHESANLVAVLTRVFGIRRIELIEDMVQASLLKAMQNWKQNGIPENPSAWVHRVAKNQILDALRREKTFHDAASQSAQSFETQERVIDEFLDGEQLPDSLLRMMFVCCHPSLERKTQIALTLQTLCGFGVAEIAHGLFLPSETVKKRLQRAKKTLKAADLQIELPSDNELSQRLHVVHDVLYLMFNEGYSTSHGVDPIRDDICEEAARLCHLLCESPCSSSASKALLALLLFHSARLEARTDQDGAVVLLEEQDRSKWDQRLICFAQFWLSQSKCDQPTTFHYEAAIAKQHCIASSVQTTDWETIVQFYHRLLQLRDSPLYRLNRAIALGEAGATQEALSHMRLLRQQPNMKNYQLLDCAFARIHELEGALQEAADYYLSALSKSTTPHEKELIQKKLSYLIRE